MSKDLNPYDPPQEDILSPTDLSSSTGMENRIVWTIWLTYGAFYFCRTNIAAAVSGIEMPISDGGLGLTRGQIGIILASLKLAYGFGQFFNGQLSERISPRILLAVGMFGSALLNVLFGFSTGFYFLLFIWACNGYCQSLGWTPCVKVVSNWIPSLRRGKAFGIIGTGYQITLGLTFIISGFSVYMLGWRAAMYIPAMILAAAGVFMLFFLKDAPPAHTQDGNGSAAGAPQLQKNSVVENLILTISNPALWLLGISLGLLNACRYGFLDWGISHLVSVQPGEVASQQEGDVLKAAFKYGVLAIGAVAGSYLSGWATDRFFGSRRAPVICILLVTLGVMTLFYESIARTSPFLTVILLSVIGFCIYGPQVLLVGTAPADLARKGASAAAAGFVNFMGYMGAASGDLVTGYFSEDEHGGWQVAIYIWAGWAFAAAFFAALLWNTTSKSNSKKDSQEEQQESK